MAAAGTNRGGPPPSPVQLKAVEVLEGAGWLNYDETIERIGAVVKPGHAMRRVERARKNRNGPAERVRPRSTEALITSGRRMIVREALLPPAFEFRGQGPQRQIRMAHLPPRIIKDREMRERGLRISMEDLLASDHRRPLVDKLGEGALRDLVLDLAEEIRPVRKRMRLRSADADS